MEGSRGWYDPRWHYAHEPETRAALDLIGADHFSAADRGVFGPILDALLKDGDRYMHLADLQAYAAMQSRISALYEDQEEWARRSILNLASSGKFSSDRAIAEYASEIWQAPQSLIPC